MACVMMALAGAANPAPAISDEAGGRRISDEAGGRRIDPPSRITFNRGPGYGTGPGMMASREEAKAFILPSASRPTNAAVIVNENESPESIVRRFRREVMSAGIIQECRRRRFFETPQEKRKRKQQALARRRKMNRRAASGNRFMGTGTGGGGFRDFTPKPPVKTKEEEDLEFFGDLDDVVIQM